MRTGLLFILHLLVYVSFSSRRLDNGGRNRGSRIGKVYFRCPSFRSHSAGLLVGGCSSGLRMVVIIDQQRNSSGTTRRELGNHTRGALLLLLEWLLLMRRVTTNQMEQACEKRKISLAVVAMAIQNEQDALSVDMFLEEVCHGSPPSSCLCI